jgi:hypothetical protein
MRWFCHFFHRLGWPVRGHQVCMVCGRKWKAVIR